MLTGTTTVEKEQPTVEEELMNQPMGEDEQVMGTNGDRGNGRGNRQRRNRTVEPRALGNSSSEIKI